MYQHFWVPNIGQHLVGLGVQNICVVYPLLDRGVVVTHSFELLFMLSRWLILDEIFVGIEVVKIIVD